MSKVDGKQVYPEEEVKEVDNVSNNSGSDIGFDD